MTHSTALPKQVAIGAILVIAVVAGWWWSASREPERVSGVQLIDPTNRTVVEPVVGTDMAFIVSDINGAATVGDRTMDANSKSTVSVRFKLPSERESLPPGILKVYKTKPNGGRVLMQSAISKPTRTQDELEWQVDFDVSPIRVTGEFGVEIRGTGENGFVYYVPASTTVKVVN